jgi:hypothetical protein
MEGKEERLEFWIDSRIWAHSSDNDRGEKQSVVTESEIVGL